MQKIEPTMRVTNPVGSVVEEKTSNNGLLDSLFETEIDIEIKAIDSESELNDRKSSAEESFDDSEASEESSTSAETEVQVLSDSNDSKKEEIQVGKATTSQVTEPSSVKVSDLERHYADIENNLEQLLSNVSSGASSEALPGTLVEDSLDKLANSGVYSNIPNESLELQIKQNQILEASPLSTAAENSKIENLDIVQNINIDKALKQESIISEKNLDNRPLLDNLQSLDQQANSDENSDEFLDNSELAENLNQELFQENAKISDSKLLLNIDPEEIDSELTVNFGSDFTKLNDLNLDSNELGSSTKLDSVQKSEANPSSPRMHQHISQQIFPHLTKAIQQGTHEMKLRLDPPEWGDLDIEIEVKDSVARVNMKAEKEGVREIIQANLGDLQAALDKLGIRLEELNVEYSGESQAEADEQNFLDKNNEQDEAIIEEDSKEITSLYSTQGTLLDQHL